MKRKLLFVVVTIALQACHESGKSRISAREPYPSASVLRQSGTASGINYSGLAIPHEQLELNFAAQGTIKSIFVQEGQYVKKGQLLALLDTSIAYQDKMAKQAQLSLAQANYKRCELLHNAKSLSDQEMDIAAFQLKAAKAAGNISTQQLAQSRLIAPIDGMIIKRKTNVGASAGPATPVLSIISTEDMDIEFSVPLSETKEIKPGQNFWVEIPQLNFMKVATVNAVYPASQSGAQSYTARISIKGQWDIKPGMVANISRLQNAVKPSFTIPIKALIKGYSGNPVVMIVHDRTIHEVNIEIIDYLGDMVTVVGKLDTNDQLITEGQNYLYEGQTLE